MKYDVIMFFIIKVREFEEHEDVVDREISHVQEYYNQPKLSKYYLSL